MDFHRVSVPFRGFRGLQVPGMLSGPTATSVVSVPFRGFRGLQAVGPDGPVRPVGVSVPFRGFRGLQDCMHGTWMELHMPSFSPLPGF